jgi:hypothetical protein
MAKPEQLIISLEKLRLRRSELDKQITEAEKKLVAEIKTALKPVKAAKPPAVRKPSSGRPKKTMA